MRSFKTLFFLSIGMIGLTSMASTPLTEQKQKAEAWETEKVFSIESNVLSYEVLSGFSEAYIFQGSEILHFKTVNETIHFYAIITDVGWRISKQPFRETFYKEKLLENYNHHFKDKILKPDSTIRDNC